ncbi:ubiquinone biosynthesis protein [Abyssogena phaseoliformis symbiont OG214]|uniref:2-polyprenylphenol 6-hydroxylase n=1 Tax=Abyssogena phaseoliformis symbiont TaxID=596095 RepID=UPI001915455F|nr:2-polyprenylphenol 6-hydroxylase [Abyssogena phaseoliformis symbiont]MBW5288705.1 Ubiquinone biosynthesis monooxygenase UbiB [Candidatus Ruthia sp. Apha_13_S6]BBB23369.1 ubiquinone biosynthesis protein [Abyssogena phaseoliformis symbiont OG214]
MHSLLRFIKISRVLMRYRLDSLVLSTPLLKSFKPLVYLIPWHYFPIKKYTRGQRIRLALEELGPIFIKFGQTLSTRRDLLPGDIGDELEKLQDSCPAFDPIKAKQIIEQSLGAPTESLFKRFDIKPLASASIAQVHTALTNDDNEVVVKVVRPDIDKAIRRDIKLMYTLARLFNKHPISKKLRPIEIVAEFEGIILNELDMRIEAKNCLRIGKNFKNSSLLYIPKVYPSLCHKNILTTERIHGIPVGDIKQLKANHIDMKRLAEEGVIIFFTQVFKHNFFHADMHPGNIFVSTNGQYIGVDFGIMGTLTEADKDLLADIFLAFFNQDYKKVAQTYIDSGWISPTTDISAFEAAVKRICEPMFEKLLGEISFGQVLLELIQEAKNFDITIQSQLLLLDKTLLNIEGLGRQLYPQLDLWTTAKPFLEDLVKEKYSVKNTFEKIKDQVPQLLKDIPELPALTINALKQLNKIKDIGPLHAQQTDSIVNQLKDNANRQIYAIFAGALAILSGILAVNEFWLPSLLSSVIALIFWFKSR